MIDFTKKYNRLFTIGCSFTHYAFPTYASVLAEELKVPLYNLGASGASNQYIASQLFLLDEYYNLTSDDLVITQWTSPQRHSMLGEDYWDVSDIWSHTGFYSFGDQPNMKGDIINSRFLAVKATSTFKGMLLQSLMLIKSAILYGKSLPCTVVNLQMQDEVLRKEEPILDPAEHRILNAFKDIQDDIMPSFVSVLYPGYDNCGEVYDNFEDMHGKAGPETLAIWSKFRKRELLSDALKYQVRKTLPEIISTPVYEVHPLPTEHLRYIEKIFNYTFSDAVKEMAAADERLYFATGPLGNTRLEYILEKNQIRHTSLPDNNLTQAK
jgi:hypothetical protein